MDIWLDLSSCYKTRKKLWFCSVHQNLGLLILSLRLRLYFYSSREEYTHCCEVGLDAYLLGEPVIRSPFFSPKYLQKLVMYIFFFIHLLNRIQEEWSKKLKGNWCFGALGLIGVCETHALLQLGYACWFPRPEWSKLKTDIPHMASLVFLSLVCFTSSTIKVIKPLQEIPHLFEKHSGR